MTSPSKTMSQCSASDCAAPVAPGLLFCRECWPLIPMEHKLAMVEAYRPLTERHLPLQRAVLVAKHREAVLNAERAIVRPATAPEPEIHLCAGAAAPADLTAFVAHSPGDTRLPEWAVPLKWTPRPFDVRLPAGSEPLKWTDSRIRRAARRLLVLLAPCWAMGLAPTRTAVLTLVAREEAELMPRETALTPPEWAEALAALIHAGAVAERSYGRIGAASA